MLWPLDALWNELIGYNKDVRDEIHDRTSSKLGDTSYGSIRRTNRSSLYTDKQDGVGTSSSVHQLASEEHAPLQVNVSIQLNFYNILSI